MKDGVKTSRKHLIVAAALLCIAAMLAVCVGCSSQSSSQSTSAASGSESASAASSAASASASSEAAFEPYTFTDALGREIAIDEPIERVAIVQIPILTTYIAYMDGTTDKLVGVSKNIIGPMKGSVLAKHIDGFMSLSSDSFANGKINVEELVKLDPDIVIIPNGNQEVIDALDNAEIKSVAFNVKGDATKLHVEWFNMFEALFNEPGKMDECEAEGNKLIEQASSVAATAPEKVSVMAFYGYNNGAIQVSATRSRTDFWGAVANFDNAAGELEGTTDASMEQIIAWDPDVILMPGAGKCSYMPTDLYNNSIEGVDFSELAAVQNQRVYCCGLGGWTWFEPSSDAPLSALWPTKALYPEQAADIDVKAITKDYYAKYYNIDLDEDDLEILFPDYSGI